MSLSRTVARSATATQSATTRPVTPPSHGALVASPGTPGTSGTTGAANTAPPHTGSPAQDLALRAWVAEIAAQTAPAAIHWCDGTLAERDRLTKLLVADGQAIRLNPEWRPNSVLVRTDPDDVARVEDRTVICSATEADAGPTNNWRDPVATRAHLKGLFAGSMRGRTMYVVPFSMGPVGAPGSRLGVQLTDSTYVALSAHVMTRVGIPVLDAIAAGAPWVHTVHSVGYPLVDANGTARPEVAWPCNDTKLIAHFPEERAVWSFGSGYGGNALLAKKCFALRIASVMARDEGWLAEHMLLVRVTSPAGRAFHIAAAFPSACGKTNFAMLRPTIPGWRVEALGDDIAWLRVGPDGRLWGMNPEAGFFGVAPGTGPGTNPSAVDMLWGNTIFTNVALRPDGDVWWEGLSKEAPEGLTDWRGEAWTPAVGRPAAHPNSRFTVATTQCPQLADDWDDPTGVPIDAIIFGGRRATDVPLVAQARDWNHGVFLGATLASERTAAAEGTVGELRRDPFAMLPFCGYHLADYWNHWFQMGRTLGDKAPKVFQVNWFRKGADGRFLWPGFGDNARVLAWIVGRLSDDVAAEETPVGRVPADGTLDVSGLDLPAPTLAELLAVDPASWAAECDRIEAYFAGFGDRVPAALWAELASLRYRIAEAQQVGD